MTKQVGTHLVVDFWYGKIIDSEKTIKEILIEAAEKANNKLLDLGIHKFEPQGITGFALLAESHISIHTWPDKYYIAIDIFTCGNHSTPQETLKFLKKRLNPKKIQVQEIKRGHLENYGKKNHNANQ